MHPRIIPCVCLLLSLLLWPLRAETSWSAELLKEVLETGGRGGDQGTGKAANEEGLILRSYQLKYLRVGESARGKNALQLLTRLLPRGSSIKVDTPANSIHLLASASAQAAAWDFLSSLDIPTENSQVGAQDLSPALQNVLQKLEAAQNGNLRLAEAVGRIEENLQSERRQRAQEEDRGKLWPYPVGGLLLLAGMYFWRQNRAAKRKAKMALEESETAFSLSPRELLGASHQPSLQQRELQQEMLGAINAAAIRMEVWYNEQKTQREQVSQVIAEQELTLRQVQSSFLQAKEQLLSENRSLLDHAGARFEASAEKLDANVHQLGRQHEKVEALAGELQTTVQELDQTKDEILRLQGLLERRGDELDKARERLSRREGELSQQQAKLAALTLVLEESHWTEREDSSEQASPETAVEPCIPAKTYPIAEPLTSVSHQELSTPSP